MAHDKDKHYWQWYLKLCQKRRENVYFYYIFRVKVDRLPKKIRKMRFTVGFILKEKHFKRKSSCSTKNNFFCDKKKEIFCIKNLTLWVQMALLQKWWRHKYKKMQNLKNVTFFVISVYLCSKDKNLYFIPHRTWCNECYNSAGVTEAFRQSRAKQMRHFAKKWNLQKNPPPPQSNVAQTK